MEAIQPHCEQSGSPPNWQGTTWLLRSAEMVCVVCAKMHSSGDDGGVRNSLINPSRMSSFGYFRRRNSISSTACMRCRTERISGDEAPFCGVNMLIHTRLISSFEHQNSRKSPRYPGLCII